VIAPPRIIFVSNDVVPGCGLPVAAPGLRVHGLAAGVAARGYPTTTVVVRGPIARQWQADVPAPMPRDTIALAAENLGAFLVTNAPAVVVLTNANQIDRISADDGNRYVVDFFAPKLLERVYEDGAEAAYPVEDLRQLRERKLRAIERADGFIVNGRKKLPYFLAWILQSDRDLRTLPLEHVGMCLPAAFGAESAPDHGPVRFAIAGYLQGWSVPGRWLAALAPHLREGRCTLEAMMPEHWGGASGFENPELERLVSSHAIRTHHAMTFSDYCRFLGASDVVLDLFERTPERELAVVTRTVAALCSGKPVVHPPFTEVAPLIEECDAGWLVDPADEEAVARVLAEIVGDRGAVAAKAAGARELWARHLDPAVAVEGLVRVIDRLRAPVGAAG
jgi:hypothetical protein